MQNFDFSPASTRTGTDAAHFALRAGPAPLGVSDVVYGVLDPHRTAVAPSPEWRGLFGRLGTLVAALLGRAADAAHVRAPRRA